MESRSENRLARHLNAILNPERPTQKSRIGTHKAATGSKLARHLDTIPSSMKPSRESLGDSGVVSRCDAPNIAWRGTSMRFWLDDPMHLVSFKTEQT